MKVRALRHPALLIFFASFLIYALYFAFTFLTPTSAWYYITGDEPHYLVGTLSLLQDGDLAVENNYIDRRYWSFYPSDLGDVSTPAIVHAIPGRDGHLYSRHSPGLSLLILPAFAIGRHVAVNLFLVVLSAFLATNLYMLSHELTGSQTAALGTWLLLAPAPPFILYAPLIFPEMVGGLCLLYALRQMIAWNSPTRSAILAALCLAAIPWLHLRYIPSLLPLVVFLFISKHQRRMIWLISLSLSIAGLAIYYYSLFGGMPAVREWGSFSLSILPSGILGLLLDRQYGLLPFAPAYLFALIGLVFGIRQAGDQRGPWLLIAGTFILYWAFLGLYDTWHGYWNPPGRMLVAVLPALAPAVALTLRDLPRRLKLGLFLGLGIWGWITSALYLALPGLRFTFPTGQSEFWQWITDHIGLDGQALLPSLISPTGRDYFLAVLWLVLVIGLTGLTLRSVRTQLNPTRH